MTQDNSHTITIDNMADVAMPEAAVSPQELSRREHLGKTFEAYRAELDAYVRSRSSGPRLTFPRTSVERRSSSPPEQSHSYRRNLSSISIVELLRLRTHVQKTSKKHEQRNVRSTTTLSPFVTSWRPDRMTEARRTSGSSTAKCELRTRGIRANISGQEDWRNTLRDTPSCTTLRLEIWSLCQTSRPT